VVETIEATGTVQPLQQVQVGAQVSGRVLRVLTNFNRHVHANELLAEIDPEPYLARINEARATEASARAQLARARADLTARERDFARSSALRAQGLNAQAEYDTAMAARDLSRASVQVSLAELARAQATLANARSQLALTKVYSPIDGIVISRSIEPGQTVAASLQAPVLFLIAEDLTRMRVMADVDEADVGRLREGMTVEARVDAFVGERFRGVVTELRFGPTTTQGVVTYPAVIEVPNPALKLRPGMTATVVVTTARVPSALRIVNAALRYRPASPQAQSGAQSPPAERASSTSSPDEGPRMGRLYVLRNGRPEPIRVRTGVSDGTNTVIEPLQPGEIRDGMEIITDEIDESRAGGSRPGGGGGGRRMF
jgi:HlyD family secretion protein